MGWQDRSYSYREEPSGWQKVARWVSGGSVTLGSVWGITVRLHASLILVMGGSLLAALFSGGSGRIRDAVVSSVILFGIILLHEFGHSLTARRVGGHSDDILLWPLGGLAFVDVPRRPKPTFLVAFGGPLVNILICCVTGTALLLLSGGRFSLPWNPLAPFSGIRDMASLELIWNNSLAYYLWWIHVTSFSLFFFNMLPIFPLDGGRITQSLLWPKMGYYRSMELSCNIGMGAAVAMGLWGILSAQFFLLLIAFFGYTTCYSTKMTLGDDSQAAHEASRFDNDAGNPRVPARPTYTPRPKRGARPVRTPRDDRKTLRDLNPLEMYARHRRRKQFERLMKDD